MSTETPDRGPRGSRLLRAGALCALVLAAMAGGWLWSRQPPPSGDFQGSLEHGGFQRTWWVHRPSPPRRQPLPAVIVLHGRGGTPSQVMDDGGWNQLADQAGFVAVYPAAVGDLPRWNALWNRGGKHGVEVFPADDPSFLRALIQRLPALYRIDPRRIYLCGYSNGGELSATMAGHSPDLLAGVGLVASTVGGREGSPPRTAPVPVPPVPILHIQGEEDPSMPYRGGGPRDLLSSAESALFWARAYGAPDRPSRIESLAGARRETWQGHGPRAVSCLISIPGWGHEWPDRNTRAPISAREELWRFFSQHQLP